MLTERRTTIGLLTTFAILATWAGAASGNSNVWVLDAQGETKQAYQVGGDGKWTVKASPMGGNTRIDFTTVPPQPASNGNQPLPGSPPGDLFLVNQTQMSLPPLDPAIPAVSLAGLSSAPANANKPGIGIAPEESLTSFTGTIAVTLTGVPRSGVTETLSLHWKINAGPEQSEMSPQHVFYLVQDGIYSVDAWATHGTESDHRVKTYEIESDHPDGFRRDTDGDGIPDLWEAENGLNPLVNDIGQDSDGDGWTDFEEIIRGSDPNDPDDVPVDTDGDGWSDYDEEVRGTTIDDAPLDLNPYPDRPVATRLMEVEYLVSGTVSRPDVGELTVLDVLWNRRYDQAALPTTDELAQFGLTESDIIPDHLKAGLAATALAGGNLPPLRLPAGEPLIPRVVHLDTNGEGDCWVARGWLDSAADVTPAGVTAYLAGLATPWMDAEEWEAGYKDYLAATLVQNVATTLSPASGRGVSLIEGLVAWYADLGDGALVLLGNQSSIKPVEAVAALRAAIGDVPGDGELVDEIVEEGRSLDQLHAELAAIAVVGEELADFASAVDDAFPDGTVTTCSSKGLDPPLTTSSAIAALTQGTMPDDHVTYVSRLYTFVSQDHPDLAVLLGFPGDDFDGDGLTNEEELAQKAGDASDPTLADTDGDSLLDGDDPCPRDATNTCLLIPSQEGDADMDGVPDWIDNCMNDANPDQIDGNDDGIGDVCRRFASIRTPSSNLTVQTGSQVLFTSIVVTDPPTPPVLPLSYLWEFDGAHPDSTLANPGLLTLNVPGSYTIGLTVTDATLMSVPGDVRVITVQGVPLVTMSVALNGPYVAAEGEPVHMAAAAESMHGTPEVFEWSFGDLTPAGTGTAAMHVYAQQGSYDVSVTVMDDVGAMASESTTAEIADTAPRPSFGHAPGVEPLDVVFTDLSTAHDGIVSWTWDFDDLTPGSAEQHPVHTFPAPDVYVVTLTTVDGDGSAATATRNVAVGLEPVPAMSLWSVLLLVVCLAAAMWWLALTGRVQGFPRP